MILLLQAIFFAGAPIVFLGFVLCAGVVMIFGSFQVGNHLTEEERAGPEVIKLFSCSTNSTEHEISTAHRN